MTDIGLYPVLRTRPGLTPPQICLPSTLSGTGHTCTSTRAFASGFLQAHITITPLPSATLRLHQAGSGLCQVIVSLSYLTSPYSSRAKPGTQPGHSVERKDHAPIDAWRSRRLAPPLAAFDHTISYSNVFFE